MRYRYFVLFSCIVAAGCGPDIPTYPPEPVIRFVRFDQPGDSLQAVIHFTDGDGDLGAPPETAAHNLLLRFLHKNPAGQWIATDGPDPFTYDTLIFPYVVPELPASYHKTMEGEIIITIPKSFVLNDTIQVIAQLNDRAGHQSNRSASPETIILR